VLRGDEIVAMLGDRDVLQASGGWFDELASGATPSSLRVADAASTRLSTIGAERPATEAARTLLRRRTGALPVLRGPRLVGLLTVSDFLYWIRSRV
jgi:CBS domain-containing protein